jgi:sec-independent protein translocase protein TatA
MGFGGIGIWQLLIVFAIVLLLFGGKRLRNLGGDLGSAIKGFRNSMADTEKSVQAAQDALESKPVLDRQETPLKSLSEPVGK